MGRIDSAAFARDGYVVAPGLIGATTLDAASAALDDLLAATPTRPGSESRSFDRGEQPALFAPLLESDLWPAIHELVSPGSLEILSEAVQLVLNTAPNVVELPPPHIDHHGPGFDRPRSFTLLVALLMSDQPEPDIGNVWAWPGTHVTTGEYLDAYGPSSLLEHAGMITRAVPHLRLPRPRAVCGGRGDVVVIHPLLGHATGSNIAGPTRRALYWRLRRSDHEGRWMECLTNPLLEYNIAA